MKNIRTLSAGALLALLAVPYSHAQPIPFDSDRWEINARESRVEAYQGRQSLYLHGGAAVIADAAFTDGVIEFDIAFPEERAFTGVFWRWQDAQNFEEFYIRPHQSGNPDANQYTPVFNGISGWQLYHGNGYGVPVEYAFNEWIPVKIVVSGEQADVYIQDMDEPALFVPQQKRAIASGGVGITASNLAPARFANFRFTRQANPPLKGTANAPEAAPEGTITTWSVSSVFGEKRIDGRPRLTDADKASLTWTTLACEHTGVANLARVQGIDGEKNTAYARVTIVSDREQVKKLTFGFSDRVRVYVNDRLIYVGDNTYQSRDYRYLGTIGYFDALYLPLEQGENELWIAVSEAFGGWGIKAMFEDMDGITVRD